MSQTRPATSDLDWARGVPLDRINTIETARLMIRLLREELARTDAARARIAELDQVADAARAYLRAVDKHERARLSIELNRRLAALPGSVPHSDPIGPEPS